MKSRRMGWASMPIACPSCGKRIRERAVITHSGVVMCDRGCNLLLYVIPMARRKLVYVVEVSSKEAHELQRRECGLLAALDYLGARFPEAA